MDTPCLTHGLWQRLEINETLATRLQNALATTLLDGETNADMATNDRGFINALPCHVILTGRVQNGNVTS